MQRDIRVKLDFVVRLSDEGRSIPTVPDPDGVVQAVATLVAPEGVLQPHGKLSLGFTRESSAAIRREDKRRGAEVVEAEDPGI